MAAEQAIRKAEAGVAAAKSAYIPDITAYARQSYQDGVPFLVRNFGTFGVISIGTSLTLVNGGPPCASAKRNWRKLKKICGG